MNILFLNVSDTYMSNADAKAMYPNVDIVNAWQLLKNFDVLPASAFHRTSNWHYLSYVAKRCLEVLGDLGVRFNVVEFQDFGGLASQALLARPSVRCLEESEIVMRVHGPFGLLRQVHGYPGWLPHLAVTDLERTSFDRADTVVAHTPGVVLAVQRAFALPESFLSKIHIQRPPVGQSNGFKPGLGSARLPRLLFASKVETWKNALHFFKALALLEAQRGIADVVVAAPLSDHDPEAEHLLKFLTGGKPKGLRWIPEATISTRRHLLSTSVVVVPSKFEAFCLLAHEAAITGGRPVLNGSNPAFGDESHWIDGQNCWKFDGSVPSLADAMSRALDSDLTAPLVWRHDPLPYGVHTQVPSEPFSESKGARADSIEIAGKRKVIDAGVEVVITNAGLDDYLGDALKSLRAQSLQPAKVILVNDGGNCNPEVLASVSKILEGIPLDVVTTPIRLGLSTSRNMGLRYAGSPFVVFMDADDMFEPSYLERAVQALSLDLSADVFVPYAMPFERTSDFLVGKQGPVWCFLAETHFSRYAANWLSTASCVVRRASLPDGPFDEGLELLEDWDLWSRMQERGSRFTTDHQVGLWYRQRSDSMMSTARGTVKEGVSLDLIRSKAWLAGSQVSLTAALSDVSGATQPFVYDTGILASEVQAEMSRLTMVEQEASVILNRRAVRWALALAGAVLPGKSNTVPAELITVFSPDQQNEIEGTSR